MFKTLTKEFSVSPTNSSLVGILITIGDVTGGEGMGGTSLYELYKHVRPQRVWFSFSRCSHEYVSYFS